MEESDNIGLIRNIVAQIKNEYSLNAYKARRAFIVAPFGQQYFDETIRSFTASKAIRRLSHDDTFLVVIVTSTATDISNCPEGFRVIRIDSVPGWPNNNTYLSRLIKWAAPLLFENIKLSIYIDSIFMISRYAEKIERLFKLIDKHEFIIERHSLRKNWEEEYEAIIEKKRCLDIEKIKKHRDFLKASGIPKDVPVCASGFLGRLHNAKFDMLNLEVLSQIMSLSERDQLGFVYALYKTGLQPYILEEGDVFVIAFTEKINFQTVCFANSFHRYIENSILRRGRSSPLSNLLYKAYYRYLCSKI